MTANDGVERCFNGKMWLSSFMTKCFKLIDCHRQIIAYITLILQLLWVVLVGDRHNNTHIDVLNLGWTDWFTNGPTGRLTNGQIGKWQTKSGADRQMEKLTDEQTDRLTDRLTDGKTDRWTD